MSTYYTTNICTKDYCSIRLVCNAKSMKEALKIFNNYIKIKKSNWYSLITTNQIKLLTKEVKQFCYIE